MISIKAALVQAVASLRKINNYSPYSDARILLMHELNYSLEQLVLNSEQILTKKQLYNFESLILRRCTFEPIAYITGVKEFYNRLFIVDQNVLIPRSETEIIIEAVKQYFDKHQKFYILELGIGSGCIGITLLNEFFNSQLEAIDISEKAIKIAIKNINLYQISKDKWKIYKSNWFSDIANKKFDLIVSNPPYIAENEICYMSKETLRYEPDLALFSLTPDGLEAYKTIASNAHNYLNDSGLIILEISFNKLIYVKNIFLEFNLIILEIFKDLQNYDRVVVFRKM